MARKKRKGRMKTEEEIADQVRKLKDPFPASPSRPPTYGINCRWPDYKKFTYLNFCELYAAKYCVDLILQDREWEWESGKAKIGGAVRDWCRIRTEDGITIQFGDGQEDLIMDYEMKGAEKHWTLPQGSTSMAINHFLNRRISVEPEHSTRTEKKKAASAKREKRSEMVSINQLCEEVGTIPRKARAALRKGNVSKPSVGWAWSDEDEIEKIKEIITPK